MLRSDVGRPAGEGRWVNLLPAARREARALRQRRARWMAASCASSVALGAAAIWFGVAGPVAGAAPLRLEARRGQVESLEARVAAGKASLARLRREALAREVIGLHPDWSILLHALAVWGAEAVVLDRCEVAAASPEAAPGLRVSGVAQDTAAVLRFAERLEDSGMFTAVLVPETRNAKVGAVEAVSFRLEAEFVSATPSPSAAGAGAAEAPAASTEARP